MKSDIEGLSVIVPAYNEEGNIPILCEKIKDSLKPCSFPWEIIFVDDGSEDRTFDVLTDLARGDSRIKVIRFKKNFGKGAAYSAGFKNASFPVVATMDADLQDDPKEIHKFLYKISEGYDYVSGWKYKGKGSIDKALPSRIFNIVVSRFTNIAIHDFNCPYKVMRRNVIAPHEIYGELYRFMPVIARSKGHKITEVKVENYPRLRGKSNYGWERYLRGLFDFLTILFLSIYMKRPLHFFGTIGIVHFFIGFSIVISLYIRRFFWGLPIKDYPFLFVIAIMLMIFAVQFVFIGLISELMIYLNRRQTKFYNVDKMLNF